MEHCEGKETRLAGRDGWAGNYRKLQIFSLSSTKTRKKEWSSNHKPSFSWSLIRIHESMTVIGLEFVWRHTAPLQMSLTCYLISLWDSYTFCWWGEGHHARLLLDAMLSRGAPLCCPQASFLLHDHVYDRGGWLVLDQVVCSVGHVIAQGRGHTVDLGTRDMWRSFGGGEREKVGWKREENWGGQFHADRPARAARSTLSAEGNDCPAQLDGSHQDFFPSELFPWGFLWEGMISVQ